MQDEKDHKEPTPVRKIWKLIHDTALSAWSIWNPLVQFFKDERDALKKGWHVFAVILITVLVPSCYLVWKVTYSSVKSDWADKDAEKQKEMSDKNRSLTRAQNEIEGFKTDLTRVKEDRDANARDRDKYQLAQAYFVSAAARIYTNEPPEKQIELMLQRIQGLERTVTETASRIPKQSNLAGNDWEIAGQRIFEKLGRVPPGLVFIQSTDQYFEKYVPARLKQIFSVPLLHWKVWSSGSMLAGSNTDDRDVEIRLAVTPSPEMQALINQIAIETGVTPSVKVGGNILKGEKGEDVPCDFWISF